MVLEPSSAGPAGPNLEPDEKPASVAVCPSRDTRRRRVLKGKSSTTYRKPIASLAIAPRLRNRAALPMPSIRSDTLAAVPAKVVTVPVLVIRRIVLFPVSAPITSPDASTARPLRVLNWAAVPVPSADPDTGWLVPAIVVSWGGGGI